MIHENSLMGRYLSEEISFREMLGEGLAADFLATAAVCLVALIIGVVLIFFGHKCTGACSVMCALAFTLSAAAGFILDPDISANIWEDENSLGVGILYFAHVFLTWLVIKIIYSKMRFYVRIPIMYIVIVITLVVTAIAYEFGLASVLSAMRVTFGILNGILILLPLLPESSGGGSGFEDLIAGMIGDEY